MARSILISDPLEESIQVVVDCLGKNGFETDVACNGKDAQLKSYRKKYYAVFLDLDTENHSGIEVLKYLRTKTTGIKIIITVESEKRLKELALSKRDLLKLGVSDVVVKPYTTTSILDAINDRSSLKFDSIGQTTNHTGEGKDVEVTARDDLFTKVNAKDFFSGNATIFDLYVRINPNRYVKILHQGDCFSREQINNYLNKSEFLYFRTKDRSLYIQYLNHIAGKLMKKSSPKLLATKTNIVRGATEKFVEEIYCEGVKPEMVEMGEKVCRNILDLISKERDLYKIVRKMRDTDDNLYSHSFLVVFFSCMICHQLEWDTYSTIQKISLGGMLHDIGKVKLDPFVKNMAPEDMSDKQYDNYIKHPDLGVDILQNCDWIPAEVRQIVLQHHETMDGEGFPKGLSGFKIFPLAQVVGFTDKCANLMKKNQIPPLSAMKMLLGDHGNVFKYNQQVVKSFIKCLINSELDF